MCVVCLHPTASCCQRGGGAYERTSERDVEKERSVVERERELASVVSVAALDWFYTHTDTHTFPVCSTHRCIPTHASFHTHLHLSARAISHASFRSFPSFPSCSLSFTHIHAHTCSLSLCFFSSHSHPGTLGSVNLSLSLSLSYTHIHTHLAKRHSTGILSCGRWACLSACSMWVQLSGTWGRQTWSDLLVNILPWITSWHHCFRRTFQLLERLALS